MSNLDSITPNPRKPKPKARMTSVGAPPLKAEEAKRRKKMLWFSVVSITIIIVIVWFGTLDSRLRSDGKNNTAWQNLKSKLGGFFSFNQSGNPGIKNINLNSPSKEQLEFLREQVFPSGAANLNANINVNAAENANANINSSQNSNLNVNSKINQNTNAS